MKRIDQIPQLTQKCTGCMACVDACPAGCITPAVGADGFNYTTLNAAACISCGKCLSVCPIETQKKHAEQQHLFAAYVTDPVGRDNGSSGGIFELLATHFLEKGHYVCGAAFEGTLLKHRIAASKEDLKPLLKSKYVQSNTEGIYEKVVSLLKKGEHVFFCGTPCQVSALVNSTPDALQKNLFTADIICHGVPSQTVFQSYIETLEKKHGGKVSEFSFRVKCNQFKHAHGYSYKVTRNGKSSVVNGIYTNSTYYNAFKNYLIFRNSCYNCQYATLERVSDITLADFWGIEKYDFKGNVDAGVSMVITNTERGLNAFSAIQDQTESKQFPIQYGIDSNYCLTHTTKKPKSRDTIIDEIATRGYEATAKKHFGCSFIYKLYWLLPAKVRTLVRKMR